jgi:hypothetical protein
LEIAWEQYLAPLLDQVEQVMGLSDPTCAIVLDRSIQQGPQLAHAALDAASAYADPYRALGAFMQKALDRAEARDRQPIRDRMARILDAVGLPAGTV